MADASVIERTRKPLDLKLRWRGNTISKIQDWLRDDSPNWLAKTLNFLLPESADVEDFEMQGQCHTQWCWAAVAASIGELSTNGANHKQQCEIANDQLQATHGNCCVAACHVVGLPYDVPGHLSRALDFVNCRKDFFAEKPLLPKIQEEIRQRNPVCVHIQWNEPPAGRFHFVVIVGFGPGGYVIIKDPARGNDTKHTIKYDKFPQSYPYHQGASWEHTLLTKRV